jgi:hypothetical protein
MIIIPTNGVKRLRHQVDAAGMGLERRTLDGGTIEG